MNLKKGYRIKHLKKPEWGIGVLLEDPSDGFIKAKFECGEKNLSLQLSNIEIVPLNFQMAVNSFLTQYPDGFYGAKYFEKERDYKEKAHLDALKIMEKNKFEKLLKEKNYFEICKRILRVCNKTNLIYPNEKMSFKDNLVNINSMKIISESLFELLYGVGEYREHFETFCDALKKINSAKWTIATYFPYFVYPEKHIFLKPKITQDIANLLNFEIMYNSNLNWKTYSKTLDMANYLKYKLIEFNLKPRDMIDVQSFMWCITPHY